MSNYYFLVLFRTCGSEGAWSVSAPSCRPISCGHPPEVANSLLTLMNDTTTWLSVAGYQCLPGFSFRSTGGKVF